MKKNIKALLNLAVPYVIILLLPMVSVLCLGRVILNEYNEKLFYEKEKSIEIAFERFLKKVQAVETMSQVIAQSDLLLEYNYASLNGSQHTILDNMEVSDLLKTSWINSDVAELYLYDARDRRIITAHSVVSEASEYFRHFYQLEGYSDRESEERIEKFRKGNNYSVVMSARLNKVPVSVIEYQVSLPTNIASVDNQNYLVLVIKTEALFADFYDAVGEQGDFCVYGREGKVFLEKELHYDEGEFSEGTFVSNGIEYIVCKSDDNAWEVVFCFPKQAGIGNNNAILSSILLLVIFPMVASILCCVYFTLKNYKEIQQLLSLFWKQEEYLENDTNEISYKTVSKYVDGILRENTNFKEQLGEYEISRKNDVLSKLVSGSYESYQEIRAALQTINWQIKEGKYAVICIRYKGSGYRTQVSESVMVRDLVKEMLNQLLEQQFEVFDTSVRETVCILLVTDNEKAENVLRDVISRLKVESTYNCGIDMMIAAGDVAESIGRVADSYHQAKEVIRFSETSEEEVNLYVDLKRMECRYYYPRNLDEKLYNYVVLGRAEEAKNTLRSIYEANYLSGERCLSTREEEMIKNRLKDSLVSIVQRTEISADNMVGELEREQDMCRYFEIVYDIIDILSEEARKRKETLQNQSAMKIIDYVNQHYCDNTLSLKKISCEFGFNETYVSSLFSKAYGKKFSVVIERLRIDKACQLIKNGDRKISDIAEQVGYSSDASFRRAFKKVTGMTPGEYRDL